MSEADATKYADDAPWGPSEGRTEPEAALALAEDEAVKHMKDGVRAGRDWHTTLLEAIGMWTLPQEEFQGRHFRYLLHGEALDWLLLAERLCCELDGLVPAHEKEQLLLSGRLPSGVGDEEFRDLIGYSKYRAFLNYHYGVLVEQALQLAVEEEVRKQHIAKGYQDSEDLEEQAFYRIYEDTRTKLAAEFLKERGAVGRKSFSLTEMKEFNYWLFKRRCKMWDPARVASDTRKGLDRLRLLWAPEGSRPAGG